MSEHNRFFFSSRPATVQTPAPWIAAGITGEEWTARQKVKTAVKRRTGAAECDDGKTIKSELAMIGRGRGAPAPDGLAAEYLSARHALKRAIASDANMEDGLHDACIESLEKGISDARFLVFCARRRSMDAARAASACGMTGGRAGLRGIQREQSEHDAPSQWFCPIEDAEIAVVLEQIESDNDNRVWARTVIKVRGIERGLERVHSALIGGEP